MRRGRRRSVFILGFVLILLILLLPVRVRTQYGRVVIIQQVKFVDERKQLLWADSLVRECRFRTFGANEIECVARKNDLSAIGKQEDKIDVKNRELCVGRREIEL